MSWKNLKRYYVYTYLNESNIPYYVGMGHGNRVISKNHRVPVPEFHRIPIIDDLTQSEAWNLEIELIRKYGREDKGLGTLKNLTDGGPTQKSGWNHSNETKKKISDGNLGKQRSEKQKLNYRKPKSKQHAENIRKECKSTFGISATGVAGPGKAYGQKAGTVWIGISTPKESFAIQLALNGDRESIRRESIACAIATLERILTP